MFTHLSQIFVLFLILLHLFKEWFFFYWMLGHLPSFFLIPPPMLSFPSSLPNIIELFCQPHFFTPLQSSSPPSPSPLNYAQCSSCRLLLNHISPSFSNSSSQKHWRNNITTSHPPTVALLFHLLMILQEMLNHFGRLLFNPLVHSLLVSSLLQEMRVIFSFTPIHSRLLDILYPSPLQNVQSLLFQPHILLPITQSMLNQMLLLMFRLTRPFSPGNIALLSTFPPKGVELT